MANRTRTKISHQPIGLSTRSQWRVPLADGFSVESMTIFLSPTECEMPQGDPWSLALTIQPRRPYACNRNTWHMDTSGIKPKKIDFLNECIAFVFGFSNNKGEVLKHWIAFADGFAFPPEEFYTAIEKELTARKIPSMEISRVEFAQGGWLSGKRTYLRMMRERLALDTCAAPFGTGYFFSCRTLYIPPLIRLWHLLVLFFVFNVIGSLLIRPLGLTFAFVAEIGLMVAVAAV